MISKLRELYPSPEWAFFEQVRSATGSGPDIRIADGIAVNLWRSKGVQVHGFEEKVSRADFQRELKQPDKAKIAAYCSHFFLVVPAPWKRIVLSLGELPRGWGLIEIGTGCPVTVHEADERTAVRDLDADFMRSLLRAATTQGGDAATIAGAPLSVINRPGLSRSHVGLVCGHAAPMPLDKKMPAKVPCFACAAGQPAEIEVVETMIADADDDEVLKLYAQIERQMEARGLRAVEEAS